MDRSDERTRSPPGGDLTCPDCGMTREQFRRNRGHEHRRFVRGEADRRPRRQELAAGDGDAPGGTHARQRHGPAAHLLAQPQRREGRRLGAVRQRPGIVARHHPQRASVHGKTQVANEGCPPVGNGHHIEPLRRLLP